jgi:C4-dicarboxylate-specific signal transduction histidine kinase
MAPDAPAPVDFQTLFEKSTGNYLILDPDLRIVAASDGYCRATGMVRDDAMGRGIFEVFTDDTSRAEADGVANLRASLERVRRLRRPDTMAVQRYDLPRPAREGGGFQVRYWSPLNAPVLDEDGTLLWIIHRAHDVTLSVMNPDTDISRSRMGREQDLVIARLRAANEQLAELESMRAGLVQMSRLNTIAMMASALAHDVSQPLTAARNYLSALRRGRDGFGPEKTEELLSKLALQIERAGEIVKGLRTLMAASSTVHKPENVAAVIGGAARLAESTVKAAGAALTVNIDPGLPKVPLDPVQVQQCVLNLITNAAEAMRGRPVRAIDVAATMSDGALKVEVADTGPGLPDDIVQRLYEPFATTKFINMGLGLPICRQIVREHQGAFTVSPNIPAGTIVAFTIPLASSNGRAAAP